MAIPDATQLQHAFKQRLANALQETSGIAIDWKSGLLSGNDFGGVSCLMASLCVEIQRQGSSSAEEALRHVLDLCDLDKELGGLGLQNISWDMMSEATIDKVIFTVQAWLTASKSQESIKGLPHPLLHKPSGRQPMTLAAKILAHHARSTTSLNGVRPGDLLLVAIDWVIASELSWVGMNRSTTSLGMKPRAWRNDRFWLVADHAVDPRIYAKKHVRDLIDGMNAARKDLMMTENQDPNYTILHTEFVRERVEPGMLVLGSDSHTCSAGAVSSLAIGLGAADVMTALATGETWFRVPESIRISFIGKPSWFIGGKDIVLFILQQLKRNQSASDRVIEFGGPGARLLSCDARFAIANMCTELGAVSGIFEPDNVVQTFVNGRRVKRFKSNSLYFAADDDAPYAAKYEIDLGEVEPYIALYPSPDHVEPLSDHLGTPFDGVFIGACTTTEEDLILAALVLRAGLEKGWPLAKGKRMVVPGSLPIVRSLRSLGLLDIYTRCGFEIPAPSCSLCLGIGADVAPAGTTWLSSQNRNFKNRMGKGAIGHICSAATVAASSFTMRLTDPRDLLDELSKDLFGDYLTRSAPGKRMSIEPGPSPSIQYVQPSIQALERQSGSKGYREDSCDPLQGAENIRSRIYRMGDFIDTDAIIPATACMNNPSDADLGDHCFETFNPQFREHARTGFQVIVGGKAFGCGSSREEAPRALKGLGVRCVVAPSFAYIFSRNMHNLGLLAIVLEDESFYTLAQDGEFIEVDVVRGSVNVSGRSWDFSIGVTELNLLRLGGLGPAFRVYGDHVFKQISRSRSGSSSAVVERKDNELDW